MARIIFCINFIHLTSLMPSHYLVKHKNAKVLRLNNNLLMAALKSILSSRVSYNGAYYRDNLLAKKILPDIFRKSPGLGFVFQQDDASCTGAPSTRLRRFPLSKGA